MIINKPTHPHTDIHNFIEKCFDWKYQYQNIFDKKINLNNTIIIPILGPSYAPAHMTFLPIKLPNLKYKEYIFKNPKLIDINTVIIGAEYYIEIDEIKRIN